MTAAEALLQLARSFGAAGKQYTDLSYSDEFVAAYEAVEAECDGRVDRVTKEGFEAAYLAGRREWRLAGGWKTAWTTAPVDYDGFGTETMEGPFEWNVTDRLRRVLIDPEFYGWQTERYLVSWDEDPREVEVKIQAKLAAEKVERETREQRRAEGLVWIRTAPIEDEAVEEVALERGLTREDVRVERRRRHEEARRVQLAAQWAKCRGAFEDGVTLVDDGASASFAEGFRIPGRAPALFRGVVVRPLYGAENDPELARVETSDRKLVGSLEFVAERIGRGELRVAGPSEVLPAKAVVDRLGCSWKEVFRTPSGVWVGRPLGSAGALVLDDSGRLVRKKAVVEAALVAYREKMFGGGS